MATKKTKASSSRSGGGKAVGTPATPLRTPAPNAAANARVKAGGARMDLDVYPPSMAPGLGGKAKSSGRKAGRSRKG